MSHEDHEWEEYYQRIKGRPPRQLVLDALAYFPQSSMSRAAIDLGCGDGTETVVLLERGWNVLAVDGEPAAIRNLMEKVSAEHKGRLQTQVAKFKDVALSPTDLVHASLSLPFCEPEYFASFWNKIVTAVQPGGRFAGQFFGVRDSWAGTPDMTFHTEEQVRLLFEEFEIESFQEREEDGSSTSGPKLWHLFTVIAKKK